MFITNYLDEVILNLSSIKTSYKSILPTDTLIPSYKIPDFIKTYKLKIYNLLKTICQNIKQDQMKYDEMYKRNLEKRKEYAQNAIFKMETEVESKNIENIKNLKSQIDFLKQQGNTSFKTYNISHEDSLNIFAFLDSLELNDSYAWMTDFLQRKIVFNVQVPTSKEILNLKKMLEILESS